MTARSEVEVTEDWYAQEFLGSRLP